MASPALAFRDLVKPDFVLHDIEHETNEEALRSMAGILVEREFCRPSFIDAILDRERNHPSGLPMPGPKIAIPHTDAEHVRQSVILFARLKKPVEFRSMGDPEEKLSVRLISMFALKEKQCIGDLLETLITVYQNEQTLTDILEAPDSDAIYAILRHAVEEHES